MPVPADKNVTTENKSRYVQHDTPLHPAPPQQVPVNSPLINSSPTRQPVPQYVPYDIENQPKMTQEEKSSLEKQGAYCEVAEKQKEMIAALEDVMRILDILAKTNDTYKNIQKNMLDAAQEAGIPITRPVERHDAPTTPTQSASAMTTTAGVTPSPSSSSSSPIQNDEPTLRPQPEAPLSPEEHLALLKELKIKLVDLKTTHRDSIPESVIDVLNQLEAQVDLSILTVEQGITTQTIANRKATQQELKNKFTTERAAATTTPGLFERNTGDEEQVEGKQPPARRRSQSFCF
ncbi:MAG: hypothetical protein P1U36_08765 [Legionellaceae bacterium]|nr:hypothetical protein [Legionellaceae bacterium]